jgi:hypothetical protein
LNHLIRQSLSEKKKIKDLFINVIKVLNVQDHTKVLVTLLSFGTNLCYGKENFKFRELLKPNFEDISVELGYMFDVISRVSEEYYEEKD